LAGAVVRAYLIGEKSAESVTVTKTGRDGAYTLRELRAGDYILLVDMNGRRVYQGRLTLKDPSVVKNIELEPR